MSSSREAAWKEYKTYALDEDDDKQLAHEAFNAGWVEMEKIHLASTKDNAI